MNTLRIRGRVQYSISVTRHCNCTDSWPQLNSISDLERLFGSFILTETQEILPNLLDFAATTVRQSAITRNRTRGSRSRDKIENS
jgi:hypothetical protein